MRIATIALAALALGVTPAAAQTWRASYPEVSDSLYAGMREEYADIDLFASVIQPLNEHFPVPRAVTMELAECGEAHSYYDGERPAIGICYELLEELLQAVPEEEEALVAGALMYVMMHQVGHALIDLLRLPVDVSPEEAADQFAAVIIGLTGPRAQSALPGVLMLHEMRTEVEAAGPLSDSRAQAITCLIYGSDPRLYAWAVEEGTLPAARAEGCVAESDRMKTEWLGMLETALRW